MPKSEEVKKTVGKKIQRFVLRPFWDNAGNKHYDPIIILENGTAIQFLVSETDIGEYGIEPLIT